MEEPRQSTISRYCFDDVIVDCANFRVQKSGQIKHLEKRAFDLLLYLIEHRERVVTRDELQNTVWADKESKKPQYVSDDAFKGEIKKVRQAIGDDAKNPKYIETTPGRGYRFIAELKDVKKTIAVLPFKLLSLEIDKDFGLAMAEALITKLNEIRQLVVKSLGAVSEHPSLEEDPIVVGQKLNVEYVLEGSIQYTDKRIRVTVELVSVRDILPLWKKQFDEPMTDIFAIEDSISQKVAEALALILTGEERTLLTKRYTENPEAHQLYMRGRVFWKKRTKEGLTKGVEYFQQAIKKDPRYALAYAGLADAHILLAMYRVLPPNVAMPEAKRLVAKTLELDDTLAEAHTALAGIKDLYDWDWSGAEQEYKLAIKLKPNYATVHHWYSWHLAQLGHYEEAIAEIKLAQELDPDSLIINTNMGTLHYYARQYDQAIEQLKGTLEIEPNFIVAHLWLGLAYVQKQKHKEAIAIFRKLRQSDNSSWILSAILSALGYAYAVSGQRNKALETLEELKELSRNRYVSPFEIAMIYVGFNERRTSSIMRDQVFEWLERAYEERSVELSWIKMWPVLESIHSDSRFAGLLNRMGLLTRP